MKDADVIYGGKSTGKVLLRNFKNISDIEGIVVTINSYGVKVSARKRKLIWDSIQDAQGHELMQNERRQTSRNAYVKVGKTADGSLTLKAKISGGPNVIGYFLDKEVDYEIIQNWRPQSHQEILTEFNNRLDIQSNTINRMSSVFQKAESDNESVDIPQITQQIEQAINQAKSMRGDIVGSLRRAESQPPRRRGVGKLYGGNG